MSETVTNLKDYFATLNTRFIAAESAGVKAIYQFNLAGEGGGDWWLDVDDGKLTVHEGLHEKPNTTYKMDAQNYIKLVNGQLNGRMAVLTGKMKVSGSLPSAYKMQKFLPTK